MKVCAHCFNDLELKQFITFNSREEGVCQYCNDGLQTELVDIEELLDFFDEFLAIFEEDRSGTPLFERVQTDWDLLADKPGSSTLLIDILSRLGLPIKDIHSPVRYIHDFTECVYYWETLKSILKWERRFLPEMDKIDDLEWYNIFDHYVKLSKTEVF